MCMYMYIYVMFTPTCFDIYVSFSGILKNLCFAKLHKLFKIKTVVSNMNEHYIKECCCDIYLHYLVVIKTIINARYTHI